MALTVSMYIYTLSLLILSITFSNADLEPTLQHCCQLGTTVAARDRRCDEAMAGTPVLAVPEEQQSVCLSAMQLCCARTIRDMECQEGKQAASRGTSCHQLTQHEDSKYCCEACKLGMISGSMAMGCQFREFSLGEMWDETYETCCLTLSTSALPASAPSLTPHSAHKPLPSPVQKPYSGQIPQTPQLAHTPQTPNTVKTPHTPHKPSTSVSQSNDNICELLKGELCAHMCVPAPNGSYQCRCEPGFTLMADGKSCQQAQLINRCETSNPCQQLCTDTGIAIECSCINGFQLHSDNKTCVDVNECAQGQDDCTEHQTCHNELGTYSCLDKPKTTIPTTNQSGLENTTPTMSKAHTTIGNDHCPFGYIFNQETQLCQDVDECEADLYVCSSQEVCVNMPGGYRCTHTSQPKPPLNCQPGFKYSQEHDSCIDKDECTDHEDGSPCDSNQMCVNTVGSYHCHCKPGYQLDSITQACVDINECQVDLHNCMSTQRCDNTIGSFQCVRYTNCGTGYTLNAQTGLCEDNDECALHMCDHLGPGYKCRNTLGFFRCDKITSSTTSTTERPSPFHPVTSTPLASLKCSRGYYLGPDRQCLDVNECERGNVCNSNQVCINIAGGYICSNKPTCEPGLRLDTEANRCVDIDECVEQPGLCDHNCHNTWGSFRCVCRSGFTLYQDNRTCVDVNECELFKDRRLCIGYCVNQPGSYSCQCPQGYRLGIDGASCQDIDECSGQDVCTGRDEVCLNMRGSYRCASTACPPDYIKDTQHKNRCKRITLSCREEDSECQHKPLTYSFHFITLVSNLTRSGAPIDLFMMRGPLWSSTNVEFTLNLDKVHSPSNVRPATQSSFQLRVAEHNVANIQLVEALLGPQDIFLQLIMKFYYNNIYGGTTISNISIFISQYEF